MCTQTIPLPQIRRVSSGEIRDEWKRMTNSQRRLSYDFKISETNAIKNKSVLKIQKISSTKQLINNSVNKQNINSGIRVKSSIERISLSVSKAAPVVGDHQTLLDGSQLLEFVNKFQDNDSLSDYETNEIIKINSKRYELERLLQIKCMSCIRDDCFTHLLKSNALIRDLRELYFEDNYKLNVIKSNKSDEKRRLKVLESFIKSCQTRKNLCEEIDQKSSQWISMITNANRLMNVTHIRPNDESLELVLQKTIKQLKSLRLFSIHLLRIIFEINIKIISLIIDSIPFECISQICELIENFNIIFVCNQIKPLDLIEVISINQSKVTTNKFLYYLYNEINKNFDANPKKDNFKQISFRNQLESEDITSDYFSASSNSTAINPKNKPLSYDSKLFKDFKIVFNILIQSNQRILLKIIFGYQDQNKQNEHKLSGNRQKWFKTNDFSHEKQQRICRELDKQFWDTFWLKFEELMKNAICFCDINNISVPISVLCNPSKGQKIHFLFKAFILSEELLDEAIKSLESTNLSILHRLSLYNYSQNYSKILKLFDKSVLTIERREIDNRIGTSLGLTLIDCIEPLIEIRIKFKGSLNENQIILDNIIHNILNIFVSFIETKQSTELDNKFLNFITLSILDIKNLTEIIKNIDSKRIKEFINILNNIKENAILKSKEYVYSKSYAMISKFIPLKDYRRKICSSNTKWIENIIAIILQPISELLSKESSFEVNILHSSLIEEFSKAFVDCVFKDKRIQMKFSHSGALQFHKDIESYWDWILNNNIQSTDINSINRLKAFSFSLINRDIPISTVITRHNRINPETTHSIPSDCIQNNEHRIAIFNCFPFMFCSH